MAYAINSICQNVESFCNEKKIQEQRRKKKPMLLNLFIIASVRYLEVMEMWTNDKPEPERHKKCTAEMRQRIFVDSLFTHAIDMQLIGLRKN